LEENVELDLAGRVAVVSGASRGIGLAVTKALTAEGVHVVGGARHVENELRELAEAGVVTAVEVDLSTEAGCARLAEAAGPRIDILVNNVGGAKARTGGVAAVTDDEWVATLNLDVLAAIRVTRSVLPTMVAASRGSIINVASVNSRLSDPLVVDYCAAKAALASYSKSLAKEMGPVGIRVNTVSPGPVATDLWLGPDGMAESVAGASGGGSDAIVDGARRQMPTGRFTKPDEVADVVLFFASDRTANVTGADLRIDGGLVPTW
jgi:NAD(P)-dependent dehydrogenase (short-subunit alcohol dehydrogenase family)